MIAGRPPRKAPPAAAAGQTIRDSGFFRRPADAGQGAVQDVLLQPGEHFVGDASHRLRTVLGSCVSVTLWSKSARVGAMSHFLLASRGGPAPGSGDVRERAPAALDGRYGDEALPLMLRELALRNVPAAQCKAKIFGGGNMFPSQNVPGSLAIGRRNGEAARGLLQACGIEVLSESLFGDGHRQIVFEIATGDVWVRQLPPAVQDAPAGGSMA